MICVTGAGGTVGSEVVRQLQDAGVPMRAAYFTKAKADSARAGGIDSFVIDYGDPDSLRDAFTGCDRLFLLGPNLPNQAELEINAVNAAKAAGVKHIVKLSVMNADREEYEFGKVHREVEKAIEASGLDWTFLRPNSFMQNAVTYMAGTIRSDSAIFSAAEDAKISHVNVRDIAAVAVKALTESGHERRAYTLNGPEALTYDEIAAELSAAIGRPINHVRITPADMKGAILSQGAPEIFADRLLDLERYYRDGKAAGSSSDIQPVTGRDPIRFADFARDTAATGVWDQEAKSGA